MTEPLTAPHTHKKGGQHTDTERRAHTHGLKPKHASGLRNQNCGQKKIVLDGPKENEARKAFRKAMRAFGRVDFALAHHKRVQAVIITHTKVRARIQ